MPTFTNQEPKREDALYWEHHGNRAVREGKWKLLARGETYPWQLYDMDADRTELHDLAGQHPVLQHDLLAQYDDWASKAGVMDWNIALPKLLAAWNIGSAEG